MSRPQIVTGMEPITRESLEGIGCQKIHWNPGCNGGFFEYYLPINGNGLGIYDKRLSVVFDELPQEYAEHDFMVWLVAPNSKIALPGVCTIEELQTLYQMTDPSPDMEPAE